MQTLQYNLIHQKLPAATLLAQPRPEHAS